MQFINRNHLHAYTFPSFFLFFKNKINKLFIPDEVNHFFAECYISFFLCESRFVILQNKFYHKHQNGYDRTTQCSGVRSIRLCSEYGRFFDYRLRITQM